MSKKVYQVNVTFLVVFEDSINEDFLQNKFENFVEESLKVELSKYFLDYSYGYTDPNCSFNEIINHGLG